MFRPRLDILPPPQRALWSELDATPQYFVLYGGTALALRLGHRQSLDFDFFTNRQVEPSALSKAIPYLKGAEQVQLAPNTLTCRVDRGGPVLVSFFGGLRFGEITSADNPENSRVKVASLLDVAGTKAAVVQRRAEVKDYVDIDALIGAGVALPQILAAGTAVYGQSFNPLITLKALSYFDDVPELPPAVRNRLAAAVAAVDASEIPAITPLTARPEQDSQI